MKLGVFSVLFGKLPLEQALDKIAAAGLDAVELGCGPYPGKDHCNPETLLQDTATMRALRDAVASRGLQISALSVHGNPLHPDANRAKQDHQDFENAVRLAAELGVDTVITFSGCPGESDRSLNPVWVSTPWPPEHTEVLKWQWEEKAIPYWIKQNQFLTSQGVRVAIEAHPGFLVYNTETMLKLRDACGAQIGANFDPSHLFWQQINPLASIKALAQAGALFHVHAKDTAFDTQNLEVNGVLDVKSYQDELHRSWIFRTVGYGHGEETWRSILSMLQTVNYQGVISIEHEDSLMSIEEGFHKAVSFLKQNLIRESRPEVWWT